MISVKIKHKIHFLLKDMRKSGQTHYTFIFRKKRFVCLGVNSKKTHPKSRHPWHTIHSELDALLEFPRKLSILQQSKFVFVNVRLLASEEYGLSKPCQYCETMLSHIGVKNVWYTNKEGMFVKL